VSRIFISHSSRDNVSAKAFKQWLGTNGWPQEDVFLDLDDIGAGERWKEALRKANARCEAVILLASPEALSSSECLAEIRKAEDYGKEIIVVLLRDVELADPRLNAFNDRQIVHLGTEPQSHVERVKLRGEQHEVRFNPEALASVKKYLFNRGITPNNFAWPPEGRSEAEPFPGLSAFTEEDAGIFFGRDSDILRGLDKLRVLRRNSRPRLLVVQAASGAGKSSYLRAGLWPRLDRDPDFAPIAVLRPAQGILTGPEGLGRRLAAQLSRPARTVSPGEIHAQLMAAELSRAAEQFLALISQVAGQMHERRRIGDPGARAPALVLAVDQAEELLSADEAAESERFLFLLANLLRAAPEIELFCLFTIRSDGAARLFQTLADLNLELPETLPLLPLPQASYRDVLFKPLDVLARRGRRLTMSPSLADRLIMDSTGADALPLLAFTISHLYREFGATGRLALEQYEGIGGVAGSIEMALKQALARPGDAPAIPAAKQEQLAQLRSAFIPWLARVDIDTGAPMRRVARRNEIPEISRAIVDRLIKARLLVADRRDGIDVIEVSHESLLRQWKTLSDWLEEAAAELRLVESVERAATEWDAQGRNEIWLDHRRDRLWQAERLIAVDAFRQRLGEKGVAYLVACRAREEAERISKEEALAREEARLAEIAAAQGRTARLQRMRTWALAAVGAVVLLGIGGVSWQQFRLAERQRALDEQTLANRNLNVVVENQIEATRPSTSCGETLVDFTSTVSDPEEAARDVFKRYGIEVRNVTPSASRIKLLPHGTLYSAGAIVPTASANLLTQTDTGNVPASFTLTFATPLDAFTFVRPRLYRETKEAGVTFLAWAATALDAYGQPLSSVSEALLRSIELMPGDTSAQTYRLRTPTFNRIAAVRFDSDPRLDGKPFAAFSALLIERIVVFRSGASGTCQ
jgi:hypothetical protein